MSVSANCSRSIFGCETGFVFIHAAFLGVISRGTRLLSSRFIGLRPKHSSVSQFLSSVLEPEHDSKESQYWSRFLAYIWQPQRIKTRPVIGNGSDSLDWKIHDWIAVETQFTVARANGVKKRVTILPPRQYNFDIPSLNKGRYANDL